MNMDYRIQLNMLQIDSAADRITIFRRASVEGDVRPHEACSLYSLPDESNPDVRSRFWTSTDPIAGFEPHVVSFDTNNLLTLQVLQVALKRAASEHLAPGEYIAPRGHFDRSIKLVMETHPEGNELLVVEPYLLKATNTFGFLVDFHFGKNPEVQFSRRVQQLSLSLDASFRRNLAFYSQRTSKVRSFLERRRDFFSSIKLPNSDSTIRFSKEYPSLPAKRLTSKTYIHGSEKTSRSQFSGLRQNGPLHALDAPPVVLFCFREVDRHAARRLAMALRGQANAGKLGFDGFESLFRTDIVIDANPVVLADLSEGSFENALARVRTEKAQKPSIIPVFVLPEGDDNGYHKHKAIFANAGIPTQVCTLPVILDDYALKWSIANIALQLFCKAGGLPWKVQPTAKRTLIIGISQSHKLHKIDGLNVVDKYFAFSVLTDNSGLFQQIHVLGEATKEEDYFRQLRANLATMLTGPTKGYERVVIHTSFRLRREEMNAISETVKEAAAQTGVECDFAIARINHHTRFFGVNRSVHSLVPFEGTTVRLGPGQYLIWFEGIHPDKTTVNKAYPGPTSVEIIHISENDKVEAWPILQDLVNLSGANWRGFNAKSAPVSVFYCHLVADLVHDFHEQGLPLPKITDLKPWFL